MSEMFRAEELVAALLAARRGPVDEQANDPSALSVRELTELTGYGETTVARMLRSLLAAGRVVCVRKAWVRIDGVRSTVPAYKLVGDERDDDDGRGANRTDAGISGVVQSVLGKEHGTDADRD